MITQHESSSLNTRADQSWSKDDPALLVHREAAAPPKLKVSIAEKGPTFLNVYVIPVLLLNLAVGSWTLIATHFVGGVIVYLGYALIVTVGLRLFLAYLDSFGWRS